MATMKRRQTSYNTRAKQFEILMPLKEISLWVENMTISYLTC